MSFNKRCNFEDYLHLISSIICSYIYKIFCFINDIQEYCQSEEVLLFLYAWFSANVTGQNKELKIYNTDKEDHSSQAIVIFLLLLIKAPLSKFDSRMARRGGKMVPGAGIEPARPRSRRILSPVCLPISPPGQGGAEKRELYTMKDNFLFYVFL